VFQGTPAGAASTSLSHILTGQSLGESLQGQTIVMHLATSIDGSKLSNGSVLHLNDRALPIGSCAAVNPSNQQVTFMSASTPVGLNHIAQVITNAWGGWRGEDDEGTGSFSVAGSTRQMC
jgi:hypothetical protein